MLLGTKVRRAIAFQLMQSAIMKMKIIHILKRNDCLGSVLLKSKPERAARYEHVMLINKEKMKHIISVSTFHQAVSSRRKVPAFAVDETISYFFNCFGVRVY